MRFKWNRLLVIPLLIIVVLAWVLWPQKDAEAGWYNDNWLYRLVYDITNSGSAINAERKIKLDIDTAALITAGKLQSDCDDVRFTDANGKLLEYFIDTDSGACNTNSTDFYIKVPSVLAGKQTLYFYYGNSTAPRGRKNDFFADDSTGQGLKAYYKMDESNGTRFDYALNNDLSDNNSVTQATGKITGAGQFASASSQYLSIADNTSLSTGNVDFSVSAWIYADTLPTYGTILSKAITPNVNDSYEYDVYTKNDGTVNIQVRASKVTATNFGTISTGNWYFVVGYYDSVNDLTGICVNGACNTTSYSAGPLDTAGEFNIGKNPGASGEFFNGRIDDVRVYKKVLSSAEISSIYNSGNGQNINVPLTFTQSATATGAEEKSPGPAASWSFDEGTGITAYDSTSNANNGTLTNGPVWKNESECISGKCLYFDGTDDYVDISENDISGGLTYSAWIKLNSTSTNRAIIANRKTLLEVNSSTGKIRWYPDIDTISKDGSKVFNLNTWYYITLTNDSSGNYAIYVDGKLDASGTGATLDNATSLSSIGSYNPPGNQRPFQGFIDEVKIYPYARTAAQIQTDYNARGTVKGTDAQIGNDPKRSGESLANGLVAYYPMDESSGNRSDYSGNTNTLTDNNSVAAAAGKFGNSAQFDASADYLSLADNTTISMSNQDFAVALWYYYPTGSSGYNTLVTKGLWNGFSTDHEYSVMVNSDLHAAKFYVSDGSGGGVVPTVVSSANNSINFDQWNYVVAWHDSTNDTINIQVNNGPIVSAAHTTGSWDGANAINIGRNGNGTYYANGRLDEVRIYKRMLNSKERTALYNFAPGPIAHWKLDEKNGTYANDTSGNGNTGTLTNGPTWSSGKFGSAVKFDGSDDYINAGGYINEGSGSYNNFLKGDFTVSGWINPSNTSSVMGIVMKDVGCSSGNQFRFTIGEGTLGKLHFAAVNGSVVADLAYPFSSTSSISSNIWTHVSIRRSGTTYQFFINAIADNSTTSSQLDLSSNTNELRMGFRAGCNGLPFLGSLDDVRIYNYARTQAQILEDMNAGHLAGSTDQSTVGYWKFDEGYGTNANDSSGNGNTGAFINIASPATSSSGWSSSGKFGKALAFDGTNDYLSINDSNSLDFSTNAFAISTWIKPNLTGGTQYIFHNLNAGNSGNFISLYIDTNNKLNFSTGTSCCSGLVSLISNNALTAQWTYIAAIRDTNGTIKLYINNKLEGSTTGTLQDVSNATSKNIGRNGSNVNFFSGFIDEFKLYNYALTEDQIKLDYNNGKATVMGSTSTASDGVTADNSSSREYCVPGDTSTCAPPVAEWKLDEGQGTSAQDSSGNANTGTLTNGPTWTKGKFGKAINFDGNNDYVTSTGNSLPTGDGARTLEAWVKFNNNTSYQTIVGWGTDSNGLFSTLNLHSAGYLFFSAWGTGYEKSCQYNPSTNEWIHIAFTYNSPNYTCYINGKLTAAGTSSALNTTGTTVNIGRRINRNDQYMYGIIDQVRIYDYARTSAQIAWEYNQGAPIAHYQFDECQGTTAYNAVLNGNNTADGNNGTISIGGSGTNTSTGTCTGSAGEAWKDGANGKIGSSIELDGNDDYVDLGDPADGSLDVIGNLTISAWVKPTDFATYRHIISKGASNCTGACPYDLRILPTTGELDLHRAKSVYFSYKSIGRLTANEWNHIVAIDDGSTIKFYINGKDAGSTASNGSYSGGTASNTTYSARIGIREDGGEKFSGQIDDVRIYNYALTPAQVKTVYNGGAVSFK